MDTHDPSECEYVTILSFWYSSQRAEWTLRDDLGECYGRIERGTCERPFRACLRDISSRDFADLERAKQYLVALMAGYLVTEGFWVRLLADVTDADEWERCDNLPNADETHDGEGYQAEVRTLNARESGTATKDLTTELDLTELAHVLEWDKASNE